MYTHVIKEKKTALPVPTYVLSLFLSSWIELREFRYIFSFLKMCIRLSDSRLIPFFDSDSLFDSLNITWTFHLWTNGHDSNIVRQ